MRWFSFNIRAEWWHIRPPMGSQPPAIVKPLLRGHFHQAAFFFALGVCAMMLAHTPDWRTFWIGFVYSMSLVGLFGVSALYHRPKWKENHRLWMKRLDHTMIYMVFPGTATPICLLHDPPATTLFVVIWVASSLGVVQAMIWPRAPKIISVGLYFVLGWIALGFVPVLREILGITGLAFLIAGGIVYALGAMIYVFHRPNPWPEVFGYHEIFHALTIIAASCQFLAVVRLLN